MIVFRSPLISDLCLPIIFYVRYGTTNLRRAELWGSEEELDAASGLESSSESEVDDLDVGGVVGSEEDVLRLEVEMDDVGLVHVLHSQQQLAHVVPHLGEKDQFRMGNFLAPRVRIFLSKISEFGAPKF